LWWRGDGVRFSDVVEVVVGVVESVDEDVEKVGVAFMRFISMR
jgi:hypothetical protein